MDKYLLLDRSYLQPQGIDNVRLVSARIEKDSAHNPLFREDFFSTPSLPWEARYDNAYPNVIYDPKYKKYRCYYTFCSKDTESTSTSKAERATRDYRPMSTRIASLGYAESEDGVHWVKPSLGLVDFEGSKENNMLFRYAHGTGIFLDEEETNPAKRYKLVTKVEYPGCKGYMAVNFSEDGIHWGQMIPWPRWNPQADSHNFPFRDKVDGLFKVITRIWKDGLRISAICTSRDFINWSEPREILRGDGFGSQVYSMPVFWYDGIYLGLASMFHEGDRSAEDFDTVDVELAYAPSCETFDRVCPGQPFIPRGQGRYPTGDFDCGCIYAAAPIDMGDGRLCFYYMGGNGRHTNFRETSFARGFLKKDCFAWYEPRDPEREAVIPTCRFNIYGDELSVLAEAEEGGSWSAAVCPTWKDEPLEGFGFEDCTLTPGEDGYTRVTWKRALTELENAAVCLVFRLRKSRLYALRCELVRSGERYYEGAPTV